MWGVKLKYMPLIEGRHLPHGDCDARAPRPSPLMEEGNGEEGECGGLEDRTRDGTSKTNTEDS